METDLIWTGEEAFTWAGSTWDGMGGEVTLFDPVANTWVSITEMNAPDLNGRNLHSSIWTESQMIIWGGDGTGAAYTSSTNTWNPLEVAGAPSKRTDHTAIWTGEKMIIWGGNNLTNGSFENTGGRFTP